MAPIERIVDALPVVFFVLGIAIERRFTARSYPAVPWWRTKCIAFSIGGGLVAIAARAVIGELGTVRLLDGERLGGWGAAAGVLALTFCTYWVHRMLLHRVDRAFRWFHQLHHSAERVDVFGANFGHPFQIVLQVCVMAIVLTVGLGLPHLIASLTIAIVSLMNTFQHLNVRTPVWIGYITQRPEAHNIHHQRGVHAWNYSDLPLWDIVFGTFHNPDWSRSPIAVEVGYYDLASTRIGEMLLGRDVTAIAR